MNRKIAFVSVILTVMVLVITTCSGNPIDSEDNEDVQGCSSDQDCGSSQACKSGDCINPCSTDNLSCGTRAECAVDNHRAICKCLPGLIGDPYSQCVSKENLLGIDSPFTAKWKGPFFDYYLRLYFFNVTNHEDFQKGSKPVFEEIGPFTYSEILEKINVTWLDNGKKVEYGLKRIYRFQPELSIASEDTRLILPNLPMISALVSVVHLPESEILVRKAFGSMLEVFNQTLFEEFSVKDILWGYNNKLIAFSRRLFPEGKAYPYEKFGLFNGKNNTVEAFTTVWTGKKDVLDVGNVYSWDDETEWDFWKNDSMCNTIMGTDGSIFHPEIQPNETLHVFNRDLCRSLPLVYQKDILDENGVVRGYRFVPPENLFAPPSENPDNAWFCLNEEGCNVLKGLFNMGSPTMMSWPHFFQADPKLLEAVEGLKPDPEKHQFYIDLQPKLGTSLREHACSQINIQMNKVDDVPRARGVRDIVFPFVWFCNGHL